VKQTPLRMEAGLRPFGTTFGNGDADRRHFQMDCERDRYLAAKRAVPADRHFVLARDPTEHTIHDRVVAWMQATLEREHPAWAASVEPRCYADVSAAVQEDFAVVGGGPDGQGEVLAAWVCFPSGWRPEGIRGAGFSAVHGPVPGFAERDEATRAMVRSMIERGPYVRFVWTITADDVLDHHPDGWTPQDWPATARGWLRVERQVTVPFPAVHASLFLIRTYCYPFESLGARKRRTLREALRAMPPDVARYRGLTPSIRTTAEALLGPDE
jgi:hypothetical protein